MNKRLPKLTTKGWKLEGNEPYFYINSATGVAPGRLEERWPEASGEGGVPYEVMHGLIGDRVGETIVGELYIRRTVEEKLFELTGQEYTRKGVVKVVERLRAQGYPFAYVRGELSTDTSSLSPALEQYVEKVYEGRCARLEEARAAKKREE